MLADHNEQKIPPSWNSAYEESPGQNWSRQSLETRLWEIQCPTLKARGIGF